MPDGEWENESPEAIERVRIAKPREFCSALVKALGLGGERVRGITINAQVGEVPEITVRRIATAKDQALLEAADLMGALVPASEIKV